MNKSIFITILLSAVISLHVQSTNAAFEDLKKKAAELKEKFLGKKEKMQEGNQEIVQKQIDLLYPEEKQLVSRHLVTIPKIKDLALSFGISDKNFNQEFEKYKKAGEINDILDEIAKNMPIAYNTTLKDSFVKIKSAYAGIRIVLEGIQEKKYSTKEIISVLDPIINTLDENLKKLAQLKLSGPQEKLRIILIELGSVSFNNAKIVRNYINKMVELKIPSLSDYIKLIVLGQNINLQSTKALADYITKREQIEKNIKDTAKSVSELGSQLKQLEQENEAFKEFLKSFVDEIHTYKLNLSLLEKDALKKSLSSLSPSNHVTLKGRISEFDFDKTKNILTALVKTLENIRSTNTDTRVKATAEKMMAWANALIADNEILKQYVQRLKEQVEYYIDLQKKGLPYK